MNVIFFCKPKVPYTCTKHNFKVTVIYHKFHDLNAKLGGWSIFIRFSFQQDSKAVRSNLESIYNHPMHSVPNPLDPEEKLTWTILAFSNHKILLSIGWELLLRSIYNHNQRCTCTPWVVPRSQTSLSKCLSAFLSPKETHRLGHHPQSQPHKSLLLWEPPWLSSQHTCIHAKVNKVNSLLAIGYISFVYLCLLGGDPSISSAQP